MTERASCTSSGTGRRDPVLFSLALAAAILAMSAAKALMGRIDTPWLAALLALAHVPFLALAALYALRVYRRLDEMQRLIHLNAALATLIGLAIALTSYAQLRIAGLLAHEEPWLLLPLGYTLYMFAYALQQRRYR